MPNKFISPAEFNSIIARIESNDPSLVTLKFDTLDEFERISTRNPDGTYTHNETPTENPLPRVQAICAALSRNTHIKTLDFKGCGLNEEYVKHIVEYMESNRTIETLNLYGSCVDSTTTHSNIGTALFLAGPIGMIAGSAIINANHKNKTKNVAEMIKKNTTLKVLDLGYTGITDEDAKLIFKAAEANHSLKELKLDSNHLHGDARSELACLIRNGHLEKISISNNCLDETIAPAIIPALSGNCSIKNIVLCGNHKLTKNSDFSHVNDHHDYDHNVEVDLTGNNDASCSIM